MAEATMHSVIAGLSVDRSREEGIHLRTGGSDNVVRDNGIRESSRATAGFG
ncbi:hypothetical protein [Frankia sp. QA3]|uniref:hypothetical protein n=1 Tax=Frankia sp. QA3 TaxID=710111 RepID=UPI0012FBCC85|nr:hypothetical protein [Frankia sp. QA3]